MTGYLMLGAHCEERRPTFNGDMGFTIGHGLLAGICRHLENNPFVKAVFSVMGDAALK